MELTTNRIYREHNGWTFIAVEATLFIDGKETNVVYGKSRTSDNEPFVESIELYRGENYIVGSTARSWSRKYDLNNLPLKYKEAVHDLIMHHLTTNWNLVKIRLKNNPK